jgi:hypothetical protein
MKKKTKIPAIIIIALFVALIILYNFGTSQYCIKKFILPIVAKKTNSKIEVAEIKVSLLRSAAIINDLNYSTPQLTMHAEKLVINTNIYDLLFKHKINIQKIILKNTRLNLDLSPQNNAIATAKKEELKQKKSSNAEILLKNQNTPYKVSLNNIKIEDLNVSVKNNDTKTSVNNFNLRIPNIESEKACNINLDGDLSLTKGNKCVKGFIKSRSAITVNNNFIPKGINSISEFKLGNSKIPLIVSLITSKDETFEFSLKISDVLIKPFANAFIPSPYNNTKGKINSLTIKASGRDINDLLYGTNPINTTAVISGIDISSKDNFYIKNKSIKITFDFSSIIKNNPFPNTIIIRDLDAEYINNDQSIAIKDLNFKANKKNKNTVKAIINTAFAYNKGLKKLEGSAAGNIQLYGDNFYRPKHVNSKIDLQLNGHSMPIVVNYENNSVTEKVSVTLKNLDIAPFKGFLDNDNSGLKGKVSDVNIILSGKGTDALKKGFQTGSNSSIISDLIVKNINIKNKDKYSAVVPSLNINLDLNKVLNKKYYVNSLKIDNPSIVIIKQTNPKTTSNKKYSHKASPTSNTNITASTKTEAIQKHYDFDIKNLNINQLKATILSDKKLVFSNVNINSKEIKANTLNHADVSLKYTIDEKLTGTFDTQNDFIITSELVPEIFKSNMVLINGKNKSHSNLSFSCKRISQKNIPFSLSTNVKNLLLDPFLMAFVPDPYNKTRTNINTLNLSLKGQNLYDFKTMTGNVSSELNNISIPINVGEENVVEVLFFPLRAIAGLASNTALKFVSGNIANAMFKIDNMFNHKKRVDFEKGNLSIVLHNGVMQVKKFDFYGVPQGPISEIKAVGHINLNNKAIKIKTSTIFAGIIIPLEINGTIQKPEANTGKLATQILQKNTDTIVNTGIDVTNAAIDTIDKIKNKKFVDLLQAPVTGSNNDKTPKQKSQHQAIADAVTNVLGILGNNVDNSASSNQQQNSNVRENKKPIKLDETIKNILNF